MLPKLKPKQESIEGRLPRVLFIRVSEEEHEFIRRVAGESELSVQKWGRDSIVAAARKAARDMGLVASPATGNRNPYPLNESSEIKTVWDAYMEARRVYYQMKHGKRPASNPTFTSKVKTVIRKAIREYGYQKCEAAVRGIFLSPHHTGNNDQRKEYLSIHLCFRDSNIEDFAAKVLEMRAERR